MLIGEHGHRGRMDMSRAGHAMTRCFGIRVGIRCMFSGVVDESDRGQIAPSSAIQVEYQKQNWSTIHDHLLRNVRRPP